MNSKKPELGDIVQIYGGLIGKVVRIFSDYNKNCLMELCFPKNLGNVKTFPNQKMYCFEIERYVD